MYLYNCTINNEILSRSIVQLLKDFQIDLLDVQAFVTDSAAYCIKSWETCLKTILPIAFHVRCLSHLLSLIADELLFNVSEDMERYITQWPGNFSL